MALGGLDGTVISERRKGTVILGRRGFGTTWELLGSYLG